MKVEDECLGTLAVLARDRRLHADVCRARIHAVADAHTARVDSAGRADLAGRDRDIYRREPERRAHALAVHDGPHIRERSSEQALRGLQVAGFHSLQDTRTADHDAVLILQFRFHAKIVSALFAHLCEQSGIARSLISEAEVFADHHGFRTQITNQHIAHKILGAHMT